MQEALDDSSMNIIFEWMLLVMHDSRLSGILFQEAQVSSVFATSSDAADTVMACQHQNVTEFPLRWNGNPDKSLAKEAKLHSVIFFMLFHDAL